MKISMVVDNLNSISSLPRNQEPDLVYGLQFKSLLNIDVIEKVIINEFNPYF